MSQLSAQEAQMQSRLTSVIVDFRNQNDLHQNLLNKLELMRDRLAGDSIKQVEKPSNNESPPINIGLVPQLNDNISTYSNRLTHFERILNDLNEYI